MASARIYMAAPKTRTAGDDTERRRLIRATHPANVARHLANDWHIVTPSQEELLSLGSAGVPIEDAVDNGNASTN